MRILKTIIIAFTAFIILPLSAMAQEASQEMPVPAQEAVTEAVPAVAATKDSQGTAEEAKAMALKAAEYIQQAGKDKALDVFNKGEEGFKDRDLYVFVMDFNALMLAHGTKPSIINKNLWDFKDTDGKAFFQEFVKVAKEQGEGWVDYKWPNPVTNQLQQKSSFIKRVGDQEMFVGVGIYK